MDGDAVDFGKRGLAGGPRPSAYSFRVLVLSNPSIIKLMVPLCPRAGLGLGSPPLSSPSPRGK